MRIDFGEALNDSSDNISVLEHGSGDNSDESDESLDDSGETIGGSDDNIGDSGDNKGGSCVKTAGKLLVSLSDFTTGR